MYLGGKGSPAQGVVVFLGFKQPEGLQFVGTGFLLGYDGEGYLVTAAHVARDLGDIGFAVRMTDRDSGRSLIDEPDHPVQWFHHSRNDQQRVDVAIARFYSKALSTGYMSPDLLLTTPRLKKLDIQSGCVCYVCGMFHFVPGQAKNHVMTYTGNVVSLQTDEPIPVPDSKTLDRLEMELFLIECHGIKGLSGAPVYVRQTRSLTYPTQPTGMRTVLAVGDELDLLGVYVGAWFLPPDEILLPTYPGSNKAVVPVGLGLVVPAQKIVDILEMPEAKEDRARAKLDRTRRSYR